MVFSGHCVCLAAEGFSQCAPDGARGSPRACKVRETGPWMRSGQLGLPPPWGFSWGRYQVRGSGQPGPRRLWGVRAFFLPCPGNPALQWAEHTKLAKLTMRPPQELWSCAPGPLLLLGSQTGGPSVVVSAEEKLCPPWCKPSGWGSRQPSAEIPGWRAADGPWRQQGSAPSQSLR